MINRLIILFVLFCGAASSQVLLPAPETAFEPQHNFNPEFIRTKGIRKITFEIIDKKDYEAPIDRNLSEVYEFDSDGRLSRFYFTRIARTIERQITSVSRQGRRSVQKVRTVRDYVYDTISTTYFYKKNLLVLRRYHDGQNYYESRYYRHDSAGNVIRELRYRETNNSPDKTYFVLGNQVLLSQDSFQYVKYGARQMKCIAFNSENRPYKQQVTDFDSLGRKTRVSEHYTAASWITQDRVYTYEKNRLKSAVFSGNANNNIVLRNVYEYDTDMELYGEKQYRNEVLIKEISYVTEKPTLLLNSFVIRDHVNRTMRIIKLRYDLGLIGKSESGRRL